MEISKLKQEAKTAVTNKKKPFIQASLLYFGIALIFMIPYLFIVLEIADQTSDILEGSGILLVILMGILHTGAAYTMYFASMEGLKETDEILEMVKDIQADMDEMRITIRGLMNYLESIENFINGKKE